jgi:hypothetical protein
VENPSPDLLRKEAAARGHPQTAGAVGDWGATAGKGMTLGENRVYFGLWAIMKVR